MVIRAFVRPGSNGDVGLALLSYGHGRLHTDCWSRRRPFKPRHSDRSDLRIFRISYWQLFGMSDSHHISESFEIIWSIWFDIFDMLQFPLVGLLSNRRFLVAVVAAFVATLVSFYTTDVHFPYGHDLSNPTPQRHFVTVCEIQIT